MIEVSDRRFRERFAERCHAFLPFLLADHRQAVNVAEVSRMAIAASSDALLSASVPSKLKTMSFFMRLRF